MLNLKISFVLLCSLCFSGPIGEQRNRLITKEVQLLQRAGNMNHLNDEVCS